MPVSTPTSYGRRLLEHLIKEQEAVKIGSVLDLLCLTPDRQHAARRRPEGLHDRLRRPAWQRQDTYRAGRALPRGSRR